MATAFISYSHKDERFREELEAHLAPLKRRGLLTTWHDRRLTAGDPLDEAISANLEQADLILMLISADFVASEYCFAKEMGRALERHKAGEARAISIICRPCDFHGLPFANFVLLPTDAKPVTMWADRDAAWVDVTRGIRTALVAPAASSARTQAPSTAAPAAAPKSSPQPTTPSWLPKKFSDLDRHDFLEVSFERMWQAFNAYADQLQAQHPNLVVRRTRIDAQAFSIRVFVDGKEMGGGSVFHGGSPLGRDQICFSFDASAPRNSMNEWFSLEVENNVLALKSVGMLQIRSGERNRTLDADGAATALWEAIMDQLKARIR